MSAENIKHPDTGETVTCPLKASLADAGCNNHCGWLDSENLQRSMQTIAYTLGAIMRSS